MRLKPHKVEFHLQSSCLESILQLLVLARLVVNRSVGSLKLDWNVLLLLVQLFNKENEGHESSCVPNCG